MCKFRTLGAELDLCAKPPEQIHIKAVIHTYIHLIIIKIRGKMNRHLGKKPAKREARHPAAGLQKFFGSEYRKPTGLNRVLKELSGMVRQEWFEHETIKAMQEISSDAIFIVGMDNRILQCSDSAHRIFGYGKSELIGMDATMLLSDIGRIMPQANDPIVESMGHYRRKDGSSFPGEFCGKIIRDRKGEPSFMAISVWDITERERKYMKRKAESVSIVAGGIAHDINNLLGGVVGYMELVRETGTAQDGKSPKFSSYVDKALSSAMEISALIQRFSTISGFAVRRDERVRLDHAASQVEKRLGEMARAKKASLQAHAGSDCAMLGDQSKVEELLEILATNAIESLPEAGGKVSISAHRKLNMVTVTVSDTGKGIDEKIISKVFDPYFSTKPRGAQKGMGLSLAVAHSLVTLFRGDIGLQSKKGEGTTFIMTFPAA
jgi:PAS domain S-box-containing protein